MRKLENVTLSELLVKSPTLTEGKRYIIKWYKDRKDSYGNYYKEENEMKGIAERFVDDFKKISKDRELHELTLSFENDIIKFYKEDYNPFLHGEYAYRKAVKELKELDKLFA